MLSRLSRVVKGFKGWQGLSRVVKGCQGLSRVVKGCQVLSSVVKGCLTWAGVTASAEVSNRLHRKRSIWDWGPVKKKNNNV